MVSENRKIKSSLLKGTKSESDLRKKIEKRDLRQIFHACEKWGQEANKTEKGERDLIKKIVSYALRINHVQTQNILFNSVVYITSWSLALIVSFRARQ